jgi:aspartate aminotransferase
MIMMSLFISLCSLVSPVLQYAVRLFVDLGFEMVVCQSFAKNFGLYAERIGATHVVVADPKMTKPVLSQLEVIIR